MAYVQRAFFSGGWDGGKISWTQKLNEESVTNENLNPYYNPKAVGLKKELTTMQEQIKNWQADFKNKNGRKPTLDEMRKDPSVGPVIEGIERQKQAISSTINRFRFN